MLVVNTEYFSKPSALRRFLRSGGGLNCFSLDFDMVMKTASYRHFPIGIMGTPAQSAGCRFATSVRKRSLRRDPA